MSQSQKERNMESHKEAFLNARKFHNFCAHSARHFSFFPFYCAATPEGKRAHLKALFVLINVGNFPLACDTKMRINDLAEK
jgi:hypothetical protein